MSTRILAFLVLFSFQAIAAAAMVPIAGATAHSFDDPVFGGRAVVWEAGAQNKETLLLVHGIGGQGARDWAGFVPVLAAKYRLLIPDLPGFGESAKGNQLYSPERYVAFLKHIVEARVPGRLHLVGHSMGGAIALRYAGMYPRDVERLIAVDAAGVLHRVAYSEFLSAMGIKGLPFVFPGQDAHLRGRVNQLLAQIEAFNIDANSLLQSAALRERLLQGDPLKIAAFALALDDMSRILPAVRAPTLLIWGERDEIAPLRTGKMLAAVVPQARLMVMPGAGHVPQRDDPRAFIAATMAHLNAPAESFAPTDTRAVVPVAASVREERCEDRRGKLYSGRFKTLTLIRCGGAVVRAAQIDELRIVDSEVDIEDSAIVSGGTAVRITDSRVRMTGSRVEGDIGIQAVASQLDLAGVRIKAKGAAIEAPMASSVVFSLSEIESAKTRKTLHSFRVVSPDAPL